MSDLQPNSVGIVNSILNLNKRKTATSIRCSQPLNERVATIMIYEINIKSQLLR